MWKNICFVPNIREKAFQLLTFKYHLSCKYFVYALYHDEERTNLWLLLVGDREGRIESLGLASADCYMCQPCLALETPMDCTLPGSSVYGISQARTLECVPLPFPGCFSNPGIEPMSPELQVDSLLAEPYRIDKQQSPTIQHRKLYSVSHDKT